jgi:hypothetical protein
MYGEWKYLSDDGKTKTVVTRPKFKNLTEEKLISYHHHAIGFGALDASSYVLVKCALTA